MPKTFTHIGEFRGPIGGQTARLFLRKTPSGSHWVDSRGCKFRINGGGQVGQKWPMWFLDADSIRQLSKPVTK